MRFILDKLAPGCRFALSVRDIKDILRRVPQDDVRGIKVVRFSSSVRRDHVDGLYTNGRQITLFCAVDGDLRQPYSGTAVTSAGVRHKNLGAKVVSRDHQTWIQWPNVENLQAYFRFVLLHEVGHHVYDLRRIGGNKTGTSAAESTQERFADDYAEKLERSNFGCSRPTAAAVRTSLGRGVGG